MHELVVEDVAAGHSLLIARKARDVGASQLFALHGQEPRLAHKRHGQQGVGPGARTTEKIVE